MATPAGARSPDALRIAAAVLAGAPVGFAAGAVLGGQLLAAGDAAEAARLILACGLFGALFAGALMALLATLLAPKPGRIVTLVAGAASFAIVIYMVRDFVVERMERADAVEAAFRAMPRFELALTVDERSRAPFASLVFESPSGAYVALRPGGWRCEGKGNREQTVALYHALGQLRPGAVDDGCERRAAWRMDGGKQLEACADGNNQALYAIADAMVEDTERRSSCRRADG